MTIQEIFSRAWVYAISMKELAMDADDRFCKYRTSNGNRCLIGQFIPNEKYVPDMENKRVCELCTISEFISVFFDIGLYDGTEERLLFLSDLQNCHDSWDVVTVEQMIGKLREHASYYNLTIPE